MSKSNRYALFKLKQVFFHPYTWLIIIVSNIFSILNITEFNKILSSYGLNVPGSLFMIFLMGNWKYITYGFYLLALLFFSVYYKGSQFEKQLVLRLGGRNVLFIGRFLSFSYISFAFFLFIFAMPTLVSFAIGNASMGWGSDILALSQHGENKIKMIHPVIQALTENSNYTDYFSPIIVMIIHFVFLYIGLMILILLLDIAQHFLKSVLWALILMSIYILFFIFFIEVSEVSFFSLMTLQANSVIVFKIASVSEMYIPYGYSTSFFGIVLLFLLTLSYWKERYSYI